MRLLYVQYFGINYSSDLFYRFQDRKNLFLSFMSFSTFLRNHLLQIIIYKLANTLIVQSFFFYFIYILFDWAVVFLLLRLTVYNLLLRIF